MLLKKIVTTGVLIGLLGAGGAQAVPPPCRPGDDSTWCDPKMVAMKLQDAHGAMSIRLEAGRPIEWRKTAWKGPLSVQADRTPAGAIKVTVWLPGVEAPVKVAVLKRGEAAVLLAGKDVPEGYFGPASQPVRFIADE